MPPVRSPRQCCGCDHRFAGGGRDAEAASGGFESAPGSSLSCQTAWMVSRGMMFRICSRSSAAVFCISFCTAAQSFCGTSPRPQGPADLGRSLGTAQRQGRNLHHLEGALQAARCLGVAARIVVLQPLLGRLSGSVLWVCAKADVACVVETNKRAATRPSLPM